MEQITSLKNLRVAVWRSLKERKGRQETGCFLVEGRKMVAEALASAFPVEALLVDGAKPLPFTPPEDIPAYLLPEHVLAAVCDTKTPQGVAAVVRRIAPQMLGQRVVALDGVQDPGNVGTILRTADAAGFDGVMLSAQCADPFGPKTLRASMGSIFRMPIFVTDDLPGALAARGGAILSTQLDGEPFYEVCQTVNLPYALVIGSEGNGVSEEVRCLATHRLRLPMRGGAESLNAAVAAGIMMYELTKGLPETVPAAGNNI